MGLVDTKLVGEYVPDYISKECLALARETQDIGTVFYEIIGVPSQSRNNIIDFRDATPHKKGATSSEYRRYMSPEEYNLLMQHLIETSDRFDITRTLWLGTQPTFQGPK